jgi:hypothetical protein
MKKLLLLCLTTFMLKHSFAQITKHNWLVGGTGFLSSTTYLNDNGSRGEKITDLQLAPNLGYFFVDKFSAGLKLGFESTRTRIINQNSLGKYTTYSFGPFLRYYFLPTDKQFNLLLEGSYQHIIDRAGAVASGPGDPLNIPISQSSKNSYSVAGGPVMYFNSSVGLEFLLGYYTTKYPSGGGNDNLRVGLGLQVHLEKDK